MLSAAGGFDSRPPPLREGGLAVHIRALADAGLDTVLSLPDPAGRSGPLTGIWLSSYDYESSSRGRVYTSRHHVILLQTGARLAVRSVPASASKVGMDLSVNGQVATGTWTEQTQQAGYYSGAVYHGAIQMILDPTGHRMAGQWAGFGRDFEINTGPWSLALVDADVREDAIRRWDREPGEA